MFLIFFCTGQAVISLVEDETVTSLMADETVTSLVEDKKSIRSSLSVNRLMSSRYLQRFACWWMTVTVQSLVDD